MAKCEQRLKKSRVKGQSKLTSFSNNFSFKQWPDTDKFPELSNLKSLCNNYYLFVRVIPNQGATAHKGDVSSCQGYLEEFLDLYIYFNLLGVPPIIFNTK